MEMATVLGAVGGIPPSRSRPWFSRIAACLVIAVLARASDAALRRSYAAGPLIPNRCCRSAA